MSPTVFRYKGYRFFFFSREEVRMHVHELLRVTEEHRDEIINAWHEHFGH